MNARSKTCWGRRPSGRRKRFISARPRYMRTALENYFQLRGCRVKLSFVPVSLLDAVKVESTLKKVISSREDCAVDISGGTDAALFAAGAVSDSIPVFTYSRKRNTFYEIRNAPFARSLPCTVRLNAEACFLMAGGRLLPGREDNRVLKDKIPQMDRLFRIYAEHRRIWNRQIAWFQRVSSAEPGELDARGPRTVKADHGNVTVNEELLRALA